MKSFTRACLIFSGVVISIGLILTIIGGCLGAGSTFAKMVNDGKFSFSWNDNDTPVDVKDLTDVNEEFTDVKKLKVDLNFGELKIEKTEGNTCKVVAESVVKGFSCTEKDGTLIIEDNINNAINFGFNDDYDPTITLYIPQDSSYEDIDIDVGAGYVNASDINTKDLSIDIGAGKFEGNKINAEDAKLSVGAGHLLIEEFVADTVKLDCGTGKMELYGNVRSDANIDCGIGDIVLSVTNDESNYDYDIDCGIGNVSVGDNSYGGIATEKSIDNNSGNEMKIDCGVGNVEINFDETI